MWTRTVNGRALHFYLAGINNQNFLMRDKETGTWWQQITGKAIYGPLQGAALELVLSDELTFGEWRTESPSGQVLAPVAKYTKEYDSNWEPEVAKLPGRHQLSRHRTEVARCRHRTHHRRRRPRLSLGNFRQTVSCS